MDFLTSAQRSERMSRIRAKNTRPELVVRRLAHALGYRFRLHRRDLPGTPDLAFPGRRKVVLVHGCFWHDHHCWAAKRARVSPGYWSDKLARNVERDQRNLDAISALGWSTLIIWECELKDLDGIILKLQEFLGPPGASQGGN